MKQARQLYDKQNPSGTFRGLSKIFSFQEYKDTIKNRMDEEFEGEQPSRSNNIWRHKQLRTFDTEGKGIRLESSQKF